MDANVRSSSGKQTKIQFDRRVLSKEERRRHALRGLAISWGIALATLPLPPIHWLTVPFFFFFGFYWSWKKYHETEHLIPFTFPCPECQKEVTVKAQVFHPLLSFVCPHCRYGLKLE